MHSDYDEAQRISLSLLNELDRIHTLLGPLRERSKKVPPKANLYGVEDLA